MYSTYLYGNWAASGGIDGCIHNGGSNPVNPDTDECMAILLTDQVGADSYFALLTDSPDTFSRFIFEGVPVSSSIARIDLVPLPGPIVLGTVLMSATQTELTLSLPGQPTTPAEGAYLDWPGLESSHGPVPGLFSGYNVYQKTVPRGSAPPTDRDIGGAGWALVGSGAPGGTVNLTATCAGEQDVYIAAAPLLDSGFVSPVVSVNSPTVLCGPNLPPGSVPDGDTLPGIPLTVEQLPGDDLRLSWGASCSAAGSDYDIYEGTLQVPFDDHAPRRCTTGGALTAEITPGAGNAYYLVVPRTGDEEGRYGQATGGERPPSSSACLPQSASACF